jgi:hypothetical protein
MIISFKLDERPFSKVAIGTFLINKGGKIVSKP